MTGAEYRVRFVGGREAVYSIATMTDSFGRYVVNRPVTPKYAARTWADLHLNHLNYGFLAALYVLAGLLSWIGLR